MKYAVVAQSGKQFKVTEGMELLIDRVEAKKDDAFVFSKVLLFVDEGKREVGKPALSNVTVKGKVMGEEKGEKIRVAKFKSKVRYRKVTGHRAVFTKVKIESISSGKSEAKATKEKKA